jgi:hypothetical protein
MSRRIETQVSDVAHLSTQELANSALVTEDLLGRMREGSWLVEKLRDRRKVYLDELVSRGAIKHYSFV